MENDLLLDIINHLIAGGFAEAKDKDIFKDFVPDTPDACISIMEYNGTPGGLHSEMSVRSIQVVVRDKQSAQALTKSWQIYNSIKPTQPITILQGRPCIIQMRSMPIKLLKDAQGRTQYVFNMAITIKDN